MKQLLILTLIFLTACSFNPIAQSSVDSLFSQTPSPANLSMDSTSGQIQHALRESALHWKTLQMEGTVTWHLVDGSIQSAVEKVWLDPLNNRFKVHLTGLVNNSNQIIKVSDGSTIVDVNVNTGQVVNSAYPDFARVGQFVPPAETGNAYPNPIWGQIGTPLSNLAFASDYSQTQGTFTPHGMDTVANRSVLAVDWTYIDHASPSLKLWIDSETGLLLRLQQFGKEGNGTLEMESVVESLVLDPAFEDGLFALASEFSNPAAAAENPPEANLPVVTSEASPSLEEAGELYFFYQPRQAGGKIQLVKISSRCIYTPDQCPPLETIIVPFPFNFTLNALSWSPDGKYAAFSYSNQPNGTPAQLWLFEPQSMLWTPLVQFPYIDPPYWSPDGLWIAFRTQDGMGGEDVYVIRPDGTELKNLSASLPWEGRPYIMDGWYAENIIMRPALMEGTGSVYLVNAGSGEVRPMFETNLTKVQYMVSPNSEYLAYAQVDANVQAHVLQVMRMDGTEAATVASFTGGSIYPLVWSPDSRWIAFNHYSDLAVGEPSATVYLAPRTGGELSLAYEGNTVGRLLFSPTGRYLLVEETTSISGGHLFWVDLATMEKSILQAPGLSMEYDWYAPSWRP